GLELSKSLFAIYYDAVRFSHDRRLSAGRQGKVDKLQSRNKGSWAGGQLVWTFRGSKPAFTGFEFDHNCLYAPPELPLKFSLALRPDAARLLNWDQWRQQGKDERSLFADRKFVDAAQRDYRLQSDSPALKLGFQPIPFERIGPYPDPLRASRPIVEAPGAKLTFKFTGTLAWIFDVFGPARAFAAGTGPYGPWRDSTEGRFAGRSESLDQTAAKTSDDR
ncbi:MAG: hypothetical protein ABIK89_07875, partial [Planctomycetota bacterium]